MTTLKTATPHSPSCGGVGPTGGHSSSRNCCDRDGSGSVGTGSSSCDHGGMDSGLGSSEMGANTSGEQCCACVCQSQNPGTRDQEDWVRVLEALETVGEAEMLKKLEETILSGTVPQCDHTSLIGNSRAVSSRQTASSSGPHGALQPAAVPKPPLLNSPFPVTNTILRHPHMNLGGSHVRQQHHLSDSNSSLTSSASGSCGPPGAHGPPPPKPPPPPRSCTEGGLKISTVLQSYESIPYITSPIQSSPSTLTSTAGTSNTRSSFLTPAETVLAGCGTLPKLLPNSSHSEGSSTPSSIQLSGGTNTPSAVESGNSLHQNNVDVVSGYANMAAGTSGGGYRVRPITSSSACSNIPMEIYRVTLFKDMDYNDFGFSVSDGVNRKGVYINKVRQGGPADLSGCVKPYDRILQVNDTSLNDLDCTLAVPLLLSSSERVDLLICRDFTFSASSPPYRSAYPPQDSIAEEEEETPKTIHASV